MCGVRGPGLCKQLVCQNKVAGQVSSHRMATVDSVGLRGWREKKQEGIKKERKKNGVKEGIMVEWVHLNPPWTIVAF